MKTTWPDVLTELVAGNDLSAESTRWAMEEILSGNATPAQIAGFVVSLRAKGETMDEIAGLVEAMYRFAAPLEVPGRVVDIVGSGGDRSHTVNISTMSAIVIAGAGVPVVKHGNRASSSSSGSADVLEALGVRLDVPADKIAEVLAAAGITFCFAPVFHSSFRHAGVPRRELGIPTVFNFLGPLTNPARPSAAAVGCADVRMAPLMAGVLAKRGVDAWVFRGDDGLDEITTSTTTSLWRTHNGDVNEHQLDPREMGIELAPIEALRGGDAAFNAEVVRQVLAGEKSPVRDAVVMNAGAALAAHANADGDVNEQWRAGIDRAAAAIDSGAAAAVLERWISTTAQC